MEVKQYKEFVRSFHGEGDRERDKKRKDKTQEYFTAELLVQEVLGKMELSKPDLFTDKKKTFLDNACGDGQFLTEIVIIKMERSGCSLEEALATTYGVELMEDNVRQCKARMAGPEPTQRIIDILENNIICTDALTFDYNFHK